ncbi:MAG TPA: hypothetical protein VGP40_04715 [Chthoniobacterales bacterium]|nr:hypothetical protein [Chthoniobacterales bacterium]
MWTRTVGTLWITMFIPIAAPAQQQISQDRDLLEIDLAQWDCVDRLEGTAKTPDGLERNRLKNRSAVDLAGPSIPEFDTTGFLKHLADFDAETKGKRRKELTESQREKLTSMEKQVVSLTAYLVLAYAGPPESANCASVDFHDWHLEMFDRPLNHSPTIGDPTPIVAEITPRTQNAIFRAGVRIQELAGFFRRPDLESEPAAPKPQRVRVTGYLLWDDDHNGKADVGSAIESIGNSKYHNPWRSTAWEIHPVIKIEPDDAAASTSANAAEPGSETGAAAH